MARTSAATATARHRQARLGAEERREAIVQAALVEFAEAGYFGTPTEDIAARAGISQPYVFRLFGSKKELFVVTARRAFDRIFATFREAAARAPDDPFPAMGAAYARLLDDRGLLRVWMHAFAACSDPDIQNVIAAGFAEMYEFLEGLPGATPDKVFRFMATGMFLNVAAAVDMASAMSQVQWARRCLA